MMNRRAFITMMVGSILATPLAGEAQETGKVARIGWLASAPYPFTEAFKQGLRELGYVEGQNITLEYLV
jgi:putative ABC transport system substrate-binding protein